MKIIKMTISIFTITFAVCLSSVIFFNHYYAEKDLQKDADLLLYQFHNALSEVHTLLDDLPGPEKFQCTRNNLDKLSMLAFEHPAVRLIGVIHGNKKKCSSEQEYFDLASHYERVLKPIKHKLFDKVALVKAALGDKHPGILMVRSDGTSRYFANMTPFKINYLTRFSCKNCLEYNFTIGNEPKLEFRSGTMNDKSFIEYNTTIFEETIRVNLHLKGTEEFYNYYQKISWISAILVSIVFSSFISILSYNSLTTRQSMDKFIKDALKSKEFTPFYQPIVNSLTNDIVGVEMLARWVHRDGSVVPPYQFIPFAEDSGLIIPMTEQLIQQTAADIKSLGWDKTDKFVSINIVPEHLKTDELYQLIASLLEKHELPSSSLSLEITERMKIDDLKEARDRLEVFFQKGIKLKLDDAGTGYGGFSYIQELGISTMKVDKMFVDAIESDDIKTSVLDSIIAFAKSSELEIIAEGVEEESQVEYLKTQNVFLIQGYVYAKPMPIAELKKWINARTNS